MQWKKQAKVIKEERLELLPAEAEEVTKSLGVALVFMNIITLPLEQIIQQHPSWSLMHNSMYSLGELSGLALLHRA